MRRMLAKVVEAERLPRQCGSDGLEWNQARCLVKVLGPVPEVHSLPADTKDTTLTITRPTLFDWEYKPGSKVLLTPQECGPVVRRSCDVPDIGSLRGRAITYKTDINGDGFSERVMENAFVRVVIGPRYGARIWEMWHKRKGVNVLHQTYDFEQRIDLGGQEDRTHGSEGAGEFYMTELTEKEVKTEKNGCRATYEFKSEKTKGMTFVKEVFLPADAPVVHWRCTWKYAGAEKPPEDGKPDEIDVSYWPRIGLATNADLDQEFVCVIPTKSRLKSLRPILRDWSVPTWNVSAPYHLGFNEKLGVATAALFDLETCYSGRVYHNRAYNTLEPQMKSVRVGKDGEHSVDMALVVGDVCSADQNGLAMVALGPEENGESPVFVLSTECDPGAAKLAAAKGALDVALSRMEYLKAPRVCAGALWTRDAGSRYTSLSRNGRKWKLGGEL